MDILRARPVPAAGEAAGQVRGHADAERDVRRVRREAQAGSLQHAGACHYNRATI